MEKIVVQVDADLEDLIPGYLQNRRQEVDSILQALENQDFEAIRVLGHTMKGTGGGYGFDAITEMGHDPGRGRQRKERRRHPPGGRGSFGLSPGRGGGFS